MPADQNRNEIYTPLSVIKDEVEKRWSDKKLKQEVEDFFADHNLPHFNGRPRAVLSRHIISPNMELRYFLDLAGYLGLDPLFLEYSNDKFVTKNPDKYYLGKAYFYEGVDRNGQQIYSSERLVDFNSTEGKQINDLPSVNGAKLIDLHHQALYQMYPELDGKVVDFSDWFKKTRELTEHYYLYYLSLFVCHGVLFENFFYDDKIEDGFIKSKIQPSFKEIEKIFGVKPLIFPLLPIENEKYLYWWSYPKEAKQWITTS